MRTTLDIDDSVLEAARSVAAARGVAIGRIVSEWAKAGINVGRRLTKIQKSERNGILIFARGDDAKTITPELVKHLMEEENM
jgi:hypothetical protein